MNLTDNYRVVPLPHTLPVLAPFPETQCSLAYPQSL